MRILRYRQTDRMTELVTEDPPAGRAGPKMIIDLFVKLGFTISPDKCFFDPDTKCCGGFQTWETIRTRDLLTLSWLEWNRNINIHTWYF